MKSILIYVFGIVTGVILAFVLLVNATDESTHEANNNGVVLFERPQQEIKAKTFKVLQVLPDGSALATVQDNLGNLTSDVEFGTTVMFNAKDGTVYYDDQMVIVQRGQRAVQIGTFRYKSRLGVEKTVPIVDFVEK